MAQLWDKIFRQVALRANLLQADSASTLDTNYASTTIGATELGDRAVEYPAAAVNDAILNAADKMVHLIAANRYSRFRRFFAGTAVLTGAGSVLGTALPTATGAGDTPASTPIIGVIDNVFDSSSPKAPMQYMPKGRVIGYLQSKLTLKQTPKWYYTDNQKIWHTDGTSVTLGIVAWSKTTQLAAMVTSPRGACPFPEELHETLITGALAYLFKENANAGQVQLWKRMFDEGLALLAPAEGATIQEDKIIE